MAPDLILDCITHHFLKCAPAEIVRLKFHPFPETTFRTEKDVYHFKRHKRISKEHTSSGTDNRSGLVGVGPCP